MRCESVSTIEAEFQGALTRGWEEQFKDTQSIDRWQHWLEAAHGSSHIITEDSHRCNDRCFVPGKDGENIAQHIFNLNQRPSSHACLVKSPENYQPATGRGCVFDPGYDSALKILGRHFPVLY